MERNKLIIFDMDNTLIHSHLDFPLMKAETLRLLREAGHEPDETLPLTQTMNIIKYSGKLSSESETRIWRRVDEIECAGLENIDAEPGIEEVLELLSYSTHMVALTNTKEEAASACLCKLGLTKWLEYVMGRGGAPQLKPAPDGMLELLAHYPLLKAADALAVGDALIDIRAARGAGLRFVAYNRSRAEQWQTGDYKPDLQLKSWDESAAKQILALFGDGVTSHG